MQIVQPCVRQLVLRACSLLGLVVGADELGHQRGDGVGVDGLAPSGGEDVAVAGAAPVVARYGLLGGLVCLVLPEDGHGAVIDGDNSCPAAFGRSVDPFAADHGG
jgi:hypothetical protein